MGVVRAAGADSSPCGEGEKRSQEKIIHEEEIKIIRSRDVMDATGSPAYAIKEFSRFLLLFEAA